MVKAIIILSVIVAILIAVLVTIIVYSRKTRYALNLATQELERARQLFVENSIAFSESVDKKLNEVSTQLDEMLKESKERYNNNSETIKEKLEESGFTKKEKKGE